MKQNQSYTAEFRTEAVRMVLEQGLSQAEVAARLGVPKGSLANWVVKAKGPSKPFSGVAEASREELQAEVVRLRRELARAEMEREIVKKAGRVLCEGVPARYAFLKDRVHGKGYPLTVACRALEVSRSGYLAWLKRQPSQRARDDERLRVHIRAAHEAGRQTYGVLRVHALLRHQGQKVGRDRVGRLRREMGLCCRQKRCFRTTTDSAHTLPVAPNLLAQDFSADAPDKVWLTDITYVRTDEGWLYLAGVKDVFTQEIVGYAMSRRMTHELTLEALNRAVRYTRPKPGLLHHSDRGSQYCASRYRERLDALGMQVSMSRRGNCYDNAPMESFWGSLKNELLYQRRFATRAQARAAITEWIEVFYNRQRLHSALGYQSPVAFRQGLL
nr:IS3 family transposase [Lautropia dentalis]